jgi:hypothetical protein
MLRYVVRQLVQVQSGGKPWIRIHVFSSLLKNITFSDLIGRFNGASLKRLEEKGLHSFGWQNGYGAFSLCESNVESVTAYRQPGRASCLGL